ncbi:MAG: hypothetical protein V3V97_15185 [Hyphomicrobiaceae bacterium]
MAVTQAQIDALSTALHQGTLQVRHGETTIIYRSFAEIKATLDMMKAELLGHAQMEALLKSCVSPTPIASFLSSNHKVIWAMRVQMKNALVGHQKQDHSSFTSIIDGRATTPAYRGRIARTGV